MLCLRNGRIGNVLFDLTPKKNMENQASTNSLGKALPKSSLLALHGKPMGKPLLGHTLLPS